ncbi:DUF1444 family protein [Mesorhizobium sp. M7A.F.Ca.MR.148.00.0.0]|nr:DUF1444 family protein [Mesorhizobium sp. M7A.F.Ca.MR.148.00.0.0]RWN13398.1 MAG: DUF1444 family protein [Mesorhizobium sp.]
MILSLAHPITRRGIFAMALFSSIAGFLGQAKAQKRRFSDIAEFRGLVVAALKRQPGVDSAIVDPSDPAKISAKIGGVEVTPDVTNVFGYLNSYPDEDADAAIDRLVRSLTETRPTKASEENLIAVIRTQQYVEHLKSMGLDLLYEPLVGEISVVYMVDLPDSVSPVAPKDFPGRALSDLRVVALENVKKWLPRIVSDEEAALACLYYVDGNTMLSTSLILVDDFWLSIKPQFPGDVLFALPRRDQLFVFDAGNPQAQSAARQMIDVTFKDGFNLLSDKIFERHNGKLLAQM